MANIDKELNQIKNAVYGREVRGSIHDGIEKINNESEDSKQKAIEAHNITESIINEGFDNAALESNFEQKLDDKIGKLQPEWTQFKEDTTSQLAQTDLDLLSRGLNLENFQRIIPENSDSGRLQRAIDDLSSVGGGTLIIPKALTDYEISTTVTCADNIRLQGNFTKITPNSLTNLFDVSGTNNVIFSGFIFDMGEHNSESSRGIYGLNPTNLLIENCLFLNGSTGIFLYDVIDGIIEKCIFNGNRHWPMHISGCDRLKVLHNISSNAHQYDGLKISGGLSTDNARIIKDVLIQGNMSFSNARDGLDIACNGGYNILIKDNIFFLNNENGIDFKFIYRVAQENDKDLDLFDSRIESNIISANGFKGINLQADVGLIRDVNISKNTIRFIGDNTPSASYGVQTKNAKNIKITDNDITGFYCAIRLSDSDGCKAKSNNLFNNRRDYILDTQNYTTMSNNEISRNTLETELPYGNERIYILDAGVVGTKIRFNEYDYEASNRPLNDLGTGTIYHDNIRGYADSTPNINGSKGDVVINTNISPGTYEKWVCTSIGTGYWKGVGLIAN